MFDRIIAKWNNNPVYNAIAIGVATIVTIGVTYITLELPAILLGF